MKLSERLEALLARLEETTDGEYLERLANGHAIALQCMEFIRDHGQALAELARSVEGAEVGRRYAHADDDWIVTPDEDGGVDHPYVRVRIVPDTPTPPAPGHEREGRDA